MSFLHQKSCECVKSELDLFSIPPTQTSIESGKWIQYNPISTLTDDAPIEFVVPGNGDEYVDLSQSIINITAKVVTEAGGALAEADDDKVAPVNNWLHSLFNQVDLSMNQKLVTPQNNTYAYRSYIETLLNYGYDARKSHLSCGLWSADEAGHMESIKNNDQDGIEERRSYIIRSRECELAGSLHLDICNQSKYLLNGVELRFKFNRSKDTFSMMSDGTVFKVQIKEAKLWLRKCKISPTVLLAHNSALQTATAKYPITRVDVKSFTLPAGIRSKTLDNVFLGQVPKRVIVGMVTNAAYNGDYKKNPFNFQHFKTNYFAMYVDGEQVPAKALQPKYGADANLGKYIMAYHSLFSGTGIHFKDSGVLVGRKDYDDGYCLMAFDLTPDLSASDTTHWNLVRNASVRMEVGFDEALTQTVNFMVYAEFDNVIEIDRHRNVSVDFGG